MNKRSVRIPRSATTRTAVGFAKLLTHVETTTRSGFDFQGTFIAPGALVTEADLWPTPDHPKPAILLEHAGNHRPARGHARHEQGDVWILWRYRPGSGEWEELGRCCMPGTMWMEHIRPIALAALAESRGAVTAPNAGEVRARIKKFLDDTLRSVAPHETRQILAAIHDELAERLCTDSLRRAA